MKLLFINHNPEGLGTYFRCYFLARYLADRGHTTTIVCSSKKKFDLTIARREVCPGVEVVTLPAVVLHKYATGRAPRGLIGSFYAGFGRYDLIHAFAVSQPEAGVPAIAAYLLRRGPIVTDWDDDWGLGILADHPAPLRMFYDVMERNVIKVGAVTTVVSEHLRNRAMDCGIPEQKIHKITNGANIDDIQPMDRTTCRMELNIPQGEPVIVSMGHTYYIHKIYFLLDAFREVVKKVPEAKLYLVGGLDPAEVADYCGDLMNNIIVAGERPFAEIKYYLGAANILALPMDSSIFEISRFPIRIGDYLASGRPIVANAVGEPKAIIESEGCGITSGPEDLEGFTEALCRLLSDPNEADRLGGLARTAAEERYCWQKQAEKLDAVYADLMDT